MPRKRVKPKPRPRPPAVKGPNPAKQAAFLRAYVLAGANVTAAAKAAGIDPSTHYDWLAKDPSYPDRFEAARQEACDWIEHEIFRRGQEGYDEPVVYQGLIAKDEHGRPVTVRKFSDTLLIFRAKALMPERYGDKQKLEHSGQVNAPQTVNVVFDRGWYGNDAHKREAERDQAAAAAEAPTADPLGR